jgi:hypothetical protein
MKAAAGHIDESPIPDEARQVKLAPESQAHSQRLAACQPSREQRLGAILSTGILAEKVAGP